jgi:hypothetical protein
VVHHEGDGEVGKRPHRSGGKVKRTKCTAASLPFSSSE